MDPGGITLQIYLADLVDRLRNYFGGLNEVRMGLSFPKDVEKPCELIQFEQMKETGLPLIAGGLTDQPRIWLLVIGVIRDELQIWSAIQGGGSNAAK